MTTNHSAPPKRVVLTREVPVVRSRRQRTEFGRQLPPRGDRALNWHWHMLRARGSPRPG